MRQPLRRNRIIDAFVALAAGAISLALLVPLVLSVIEDTGVNGLFPVLSLGVACLGVAVSRRAMRTNPEGTAGYWVVFTAVAAVTISLAILGLLAIVLVLYGLSGGD